jgi:hypothetical protein
MERKKAVVPRICSKACGELPHTCINALKSKRFRDAPQKRAAYAVGAGEDRSCPRILSIRLWVTSGDTGQRVDAIRVFGGASFAAVVARGVGWLAAMAEQPELSTDFVESGVDKLRIIATNR